MTHNPQWGQTEQSPSSTRLLGLHVPSDVTIIAVEASDCFTLGGPMHPAVSAALPRIVELVRDWVWPGIHG